MKRAAYPTAPTDREWQVLELLMPPVKPSGWPGIRHVLRVGCA